MFSFWTYILVGNNNTGKTSFQRWLLFELCGVHYKRLPRNIEVDITHPRMPRGVETLFAMNRSYQEKASEYRSVKRFFQTAFKQANICVLSSHSHSPSYSDLRQMIRELRTRGYNVAAVFFSNGYDSEAQRISRILNWDERLWVENSHSNSEEKIQNQLSRRASEFSQMLIARATHQ